MLDFLMIATRIGKNGVIEIYPKFIMKKSKDLMIRGGDFYAVWDDEAGLWVTDEDSLIRMIDKELDEYAKQYKDGLGSSVKVLHMWDADSGSIDRWHKYCQKQCRDNFKMLDETLIFSNTPINKNDYASKRLPYPLEPGSIEAYDKLISTLYSEEERHKIEWSIGAIVTGASKTLQKFMVLYGAQGAGKSTIIRVIEQLFAGYCASFDAKALGSATNAFALEAFRTNPLVAIQHDGDLSRIEDNTRLNSLVSHEKMTVNEKYTKTYENDFKCFLIMGTNRPVRITDAKSGIIRRLIDVTPSGNKLKPAEYRRVTEQIAFELGAIAHHCKEVYLDDPSYYDDYIPISMLGASNDFYNFIQEYYILLKKDDGITLKSAWEMYKNYCDDAKVPYPMTRRSFSEELKNYFRSFEERHTDQDGNRIRNYYSGFRTEKFDNSEFEEKKAKKLKVIEEPPKVDWLQFDDASTYKMDGADSIFDLQCAEFPAQYANEEGTPFRKWAEVTTKLSDLDTSKLHYVWFPEEHKNHVVIDFDIPDENGNKCFERNVEAASKWPATYAELSKSGEGIHLHYIYGGDVSQLSRIFGDHIEVKVFNGDSSLRRKLTKCNNLPIASLNSGLPLKGEKKVVNFDVVKSERGLRSLIKRNLNKEIHPNTKPSVEFIYKILEDAYDSDLKYDVTDMRNAVMALASSSTNQALYCIDLANKMKFRSDEPSDGEIDNDAPIVFYDVEVFPNLFLVNWKYQGKDKPVVRMINPKPVEIENLVRFRLIGFNNRRYDNHILYARMMGYSNEQLFDLSQKIIDKDKRSGNDGLFREAYNLSYTDVYDFASAGNKKSLKKWEIELKIHHQELGLPWDKPVPEELWPKVAEYCDNDVIATEAVFDHLKGDWTARQILADLAGMTVNDTTNSLTNRIIFGNDKNPQRQFRYRNLAEPVHDLTADEIEFLTEIMPEMMAEPHGEAKSQLPYFPGYKFEFGKSTYRGVEVGEGGCVQAKPGIYGNVALLDIASQHPHSAMAEIIFGVKFTRRFYEIVYGRVHIKHEAWSEVNNMLDGKLTPYIQKVLNGEMTSGELANALKTAINSVYGQTFAGYPSLCRDPRNKDNIVAKRGALFMLDLKYEVEKRGFVVAHIKTDSIKIPDATPEIIQFVMDFGKRYGYSFEHEATYEKMCLVNDAVYIAKYKDGKHAGEWTATGTQFAVPVVFKTLFSNEPLTFDDLCETKTVKDSMYLDMNESLIDVSADEKEREKLVKKLKKATNADEAALIEATINGLDISIAQGHDYHFVGKVGQFCPIKPGCGGGLLMRENNGKYSAVVGTKGYRWLESEMVKDLGKEDDIDRSYYDNLVNEAADAIAKYGDLEWFISDDPYNGDASMYSCKPTF